MKIGIKEILLKSTKINPSTSVYKCPDILELKDTSAVPLCKKPNIQIFQLQFLLNFHRYHSIPYSSLILKKIINKINFVIDDGKNATGEICAWLT